MSVQPALTAKEWVAFLPRDARRSAMGADDPAERHALAARALYGQPFGFTREDVWVLRGAALKERPYMTRYAELNDLADRIEALLPPEE